MKLPQFSLRDLFWLVLVAACLCGWGVDHAARMYNANRLAALKGSSNFLKGKGAN